MLNTLLLAALAFPSAHLDDVATVEWRGAEVPLASVAEALGASDDVAPEYAAAVADQLAPLGPWILEHGFDAVLTDDARVVLVTDSEKLGKRRMKLVEKTVEHFDRTFEPSDRSASDESFFKAATGASAFRPDTRAVIVVETRKEAQYRSLVEVVGASDDTPAQNWTAEMIERPGFADGRLAIAGWQEAPSGFQLGIVWRTENELVNRLTRLLLYRSFGPQPVWFDVASGWDAEEAVMDDIYSFPYRFEFVGVGEHKGWKNELRAMFKGRRGEALAPSEFATWKSNVWDDDLAAVAWGLVRYLRATDAEHPLATLAEDFRLRYKAATVSERAYTPIPQISPEAQVAALQAVAGETVLADAAEYFRTWKLPKKKPAR